MLWLSHFAGALWILYWSDWHPFVTRLSPGIVLTLLFAGLYLYWTYEVISPLWRRTRELGALRMSPSPKLIEVMLSEFQKALCDTYHYKLDARHGKPPSRCYVEHVTKGRDWTDKGTPVAAWMVTLDSIATTPIET